MASFITRLRRHGLSLARSGGNSSMCSKLCAVLVFAILFQLLAVIVILFRSSKPEYMNFVPRMGMSLSTEIVKHAASSSVSSKRNAGRNTKIANKNTELLHSLKHLNISMTDFWKGAKLGNPLIDEYGSNDVKMAGEMGRGVLLPISERQKMEEVMNEYHVNTIVSDTIALNRLVPDSRIQGCSELTYELKGLPQVTVIIPFYNEWPSLLLRSVYSIINRSPRSLVNEILLIDDASTLPQLHEPLDEYIREHFPSWLVRLVRNKVRKGLINARMRGVRESMGEVLIFFDSHMEVNIDWLPPLLTEIAKDRKIVAMSTLDYIQADSLEYRYNVNYLTRYVWDWRMVFFETFFRQDQIYPETTSPRPGAAMVGAAFAMDKKYFLELGGYDEGMGVWGGENLEMSWRVWLCGGRLVHLPCSRIGHVARAQPYSFPGGRTQVEHFNYKRAVKVWMGPYAKFVYSIHPDMITMDVGDVSQRLATKKKLQCKEFSWYLHNVWPELNIYDENVTAWGTVQNEGMKLCLDNADYLFQAVAPLYLKPCGGNLHSQGFSMKTSGLLQTSLQCAIVQEPQEGAPVVVEDCVIGQRDKWTYTQDHQLIHTTSKLCLDVGTQGPVVSACKPGQITQKWIFTPFTFEKPSNVH